jgi:anti-sigma factor RsiW
MSMSDHLSAAQIEAFRARGTPPDELLRVDEHLSACAECRARVATGLGPRVASLLRNAARPRLDGPHLEYEQLEAYVDEGLAPETRAEVERHRASCPDCAADLDDLAALRRQTGLDPSLGPAVRTLAGPSSAPTTGFRRVSLRTLAAAAALVAVAVLVVMMQPSRDPRGHPPRAAVSPANPAPTASPGLDLPREVQVLVAEAVADGRLRLPERVSGLISGPGVLLGETRGGAEGRLSPAGTAVRTSRPTFRWPPVPGATGYVVSVFDSRFDPVLSSPRLAQPSWTTTTPLIGGRVYLWQVTVSGGREDITLPRPPAPPARFLVLEEKDVAEADELSARDGADALLRAVVLARAGLLDEAEGALVRASQDPAQASAARRLLEDLRAQRAGRPAQPRR